MVQILTYERALAISDQYGEKRHLLLGNGFSIACKPDIFRYSSLFENADFSNLSSEVQNVFRELNTQDFEAVIKDLIVTSKILPIYRNSLSDLSELIKEDSDELKDLLVNTIASHHPSLPHEIENDRYYSCRRFLSSFKHIFTLNYDILLYWALMHEEPQGVPRIAISANDGFGKPDDNYEADYVIWDGENGGNGQTVHYLHGALHLFDEGAELRKYTWSNTGIPILTQIREALDSGYFPLFVAEGTSNSKLEKIKHHGYLHKALRSFSSIGGALFIYGHSLADNDNHILHSIEKGKINHLFVGIHGNPNTESNRRIIRKAQTIRENRPRTKPLELDFYDTSSATVWA